MAPDFAATLDFIKSQVPPELHQPQVGIVCGSGLSGLAGAIRNIHKVPYEKIPGFGKSTGRTIDLFGVRLSLSYDQVPGHSSELAFGFLGKSLVPVVAMLGRVR